MTKLDAWLRGLIAAAVSGCAGGVLTGFAAIGIEPSHFNLQSGLGSTLRIGGAGALINAVIGVAAYLQKSPLPDTEQTTVVQTTTQPSSAPQTTTTVVKTGPDTKP